MNTTLQTNQSCRAALLQTIRKALNTGAKTITIKPTYKDGKLTDCEATVRYPYKGFKPKTRTL